MNKNIFIYWVGNIPTLIKILRTLIYSYSINNYNLHLIDHTNLLKYVQNIPNNFYDLKPAHQADFVRVNVIYEYGGIWLDSDVLVLSNLENLFNVIKKDNGFFILENNTILYNGVFGSKKKTLLFNEWKTRINNVLNKKTDIEWTEIGNDMLEKIKNEKPELFSGYRIYKGLDNMYPVNWNYCVKEFIKKPYNNYKKIKKKFQPLIILVNSVYKKLNNITITNILNNNMPLNYFINKAFENLLSKYKPDELFQLLEKNNYNIDQEEKDYIVNYNLKLVSKYKYIKYKQKYLQLKS
jgi:hypothetical protein